MQILVVDIGGTHVKLMHSGSPEARKFDSGDGFTPQQVVAGVKAAHRRLDLRRRHHRHSEPGASRRGDRGALEPRHGLGGLRLGRGPRRAGQDHQRRGHAGARQRRRRAHAVSRPRLGPRHRARGRGHLVSLELAHLPFATRPSRICWASAASTALGEEAWRAVVLEGAELLRAAVAAEYVVLGGGNVRLFEELPAQFRRGHNDKAFEGGFRAWDDAGARRRRRLAARQRWPRSRRASICASCSPTIPGAPSAFRSRSASTCSSTTRRT